MCLSYNIISGTLVNNQGLFAQSMVSNNHWLSIEKQALLMLFLLFFFLLQLMFRGNKTKQRGLLHHLLL